MKIYSLSFAAIIQWKRIGFSNLQRKGAGVVDGRDHIGDATGNVILCVLCIILLKVLLVEHGLAALLIKADVGIHPAQTFLNVLEDAARTAVGRNRKSFEV